MSSSQAENSTEREMEFSPGEISEEEVEMGGMIGAAEAGGLVLEAHPMVDRSSRWERQGREFDVSNSFDKICR